MPKSIQLFAVLVLSAMFLSAQVSAQVSAKQSECGQQRGKSAGALDEASWKKLNDIYEDVGEEHYDIAFDKLQKMNTVVRGNYQKAVIAQALAQVEWSRGNYAAALTNFEAAVQLDSLPDPAHFSLMYQIAQLYYMNGRFDEALNKLNLWMCKAPEDKITAASWYLKAAIYTSQQDWSQVVTAVDMAISISDELVESWYQLKLGAHFELEQFPKMAQTLETMIHNWPDKRTYWIQLSQIYYKLKMEEKALSILALAWRRNMLDKQSDIIYLTSLYSNSELPFKAAGVMQKGIEDGLVEANNKHWTMIADAWFAAEEMERALAAYEMAGKASDDGEIDLRRAYILVDMERWSEASSAINAALEKGGFNERKTGDAYVLQGMSEFNLGNYARAAAAWNNASQYPKARKSAQQWINHMREERARKSS
ncbi:MAG: tetratricopeptide repeat protein [Xanthomonadales bacterium]|nr:tetratricopeptide repeat protein [Xanthomonadales bacterium]